MLDGRSFGQTEHVEPAELVPLVIDIDGTLVRSDILVESGFALLGSKPQKAVGILFALCKGKAALKHFIAKNVEIDVSLLPYNEEVLEFARKARTESRPVHLASASNDRYVAAIADHLGLFDGWLASSETNNMSGRAKAAALVSRFGEQAFDYIGNDGSDLHVWAVARRRIAVNATSGVIARLRTIDPAAEFIAPATSRAKAWIKLLRVQQWVKNALIFVAVLASQKFDTATLLASVGAFFCFSIAASGIYIVNDLIDLGADRNHRTKKHRPLANGTVPILQALISAPILLAVALGGALAVSPFFAGIVLVYMLMALLYTLVLKRKMLVDIVMLAGFYVIRVIAGAVAISVQPSEWLLAFSMFVFTSLALIKRYVELATRFDSDLPDPTNRNYKKADLPIVAMLAAAAGFNAVTVFAMYISSNAVVSLYSHPRLLWLSCPILMYWLSRALMLANRRMMHDDPIVFALKDRNSLLAFVFLVMIFMGAM